MHTLAAMLARCWPLRGPRLTYHRALCSAVSSPSFLKPIDAFPDRHIGPRDDDISQMLATIGLKSLSELTEAVVPKNIQFNEPLPVREAVTESELIHEMHIHAKKNFVARSFLGLGYHNCHVPAVIMRNVLENPGWYTQYTPYQAEVAQGRLESLLNYQTMVADLTGLSTTNSSLLDEGTACAEAMAMCKTNTKGRKVFIVDDRVHPQNIEIVRTRAGPFEIEVHVCDVQAYDFSNKLACGVLVQYPDTYGRVTDWRDVIASARENGTMAVVATDLLALTKLTPPGELGADIAVGNSQRFGVPLGYGGPHAAFMACHESLVRKMPGRITGLSRDVHGDPARRLALQVREQHIRREKATSNICTAQALLSNMAAFYAVYHGPSGLAAIAGRVHKLTQVLVSGAESSGHRVESRDYFDTVRVMVGDGNAETVVRKALENGINIRLVDGSSVCIALDETTSEQDIDALLSALDLTGRPGRARDFAAGVEDAAPAYPASLSRQSAYLTHEVFSSYRSETELLRYIKKLENKDLSLCHSMIPLGSCTMKLNATAEMLAVSMPEFASIHPFAPVDQARGFHDIFHLLVKDLCAISGYDAVSLQPNSGAQGEYAGLRAIAAYHADRGQGHRNVCLIPQSAHGTNPASAQMCGMNVATIKTDVRGNIDMIDLKRNADKYADKLAAIMITYPSTYGVFEEGVEEVCRVIHERGGQVYLDGANMNALVGVCRPGDIGADGGGGPGAGPIGVKSHLAPYLPSHPLAKNVGGEKAFGVVSSAPWGSALILPISYAYIRMMGPQGLRKATQVAILNANYMIARLNGHYQILFRGANGMCAHEFIIDTRPFEKSCGVRAVEIAKRHGLVCLVEIHNRLTLTRLQDYGFHSPTMSWPVAGTLMVEPTESESKSELDRFCDSLIQIREEIREIETGQADPHDNVLKCAPHSLKETTGDEWKHTYSRSKAGVPAPWLSEAKFWPTTGRVDDVYGDRLLKCTL